MVHRDRAAGRGPGAGRRASPRPARVSGAAGTGSGTRADLAAHRDRLVAVSAGGRPLTGRVVAADDGGIVLDVAGRQHEFGYAELGPGRVQVEFGRLAEIADDDLADDDLADDDLADDDLADDDLADF